ncbi:MAG: glycosyltransferase [Syntrophobacteraceae bacterium]
MACDKNLRVLMMVSGTIKGENANDYFYLRLAEKVQQTGGHIGFYVYESPPARTIELFQRAGASFIVRSKNSHIPNLLRVLSDGVAAAIRCKANLIVGQYSTCGNVAAILGRLLRIPSLKVVRSASRQYLIINKRQTVDFVHILKQRAVARLVTQILAVSHAVAEDLKSTYGIGSHRIAVLQNAIDPVYYQPSKTREETRIQMGIPSDACVVLMVAGVQA